MGLQQSIADIVMVNDAPGIVDTWFILFERGSLAFSLRYYPPDTWDDSQIPAAKIKCDQKLKELMQIVADDFIEYAQRDHNLSLRYTLDSSEVMHPYGRLIPLNSNPLFCLNYYVVGIRRFNGAVMEPRNPSYVKLNIKYADPHSKDTSVLNGYLAHLQSLRPVAEGHHQQA